MRRLLLSVAAITSCCSASLAADDGDIDKGRALARDHCTRCHVVGAFNPGGGIGSTPSFQILVKRRPDYRERFLTFFERHPHPAFVRVDGRKHPLDLPPTAAPIDLTFQDIIDVAAFAETLKAPGGKKPAQKVKSGGFNRSDWE